MPIKVLIADDHVFYREGVRAFLENEPDIEVVGEAGNGEEVLAKAAELKPDVILMDLKMPGINGIEATRRIHETDPEIGVLALTMFDDDDSVFGKRPSTLVSRRSGRTICSRHTTTSLSTSQAPSTSSSRRCSARSIMRFSSQ